MSREAMILALDKLAWNCPQEAAEILRKALGEHETSENCWCHPTLYYKDPDTGNEVWVHNEPH